MVTADATRAVSRSGLPTQAGGGGRRGSGTVARASRLWLPPDVCVAGPQVSQALRSYASIGLPRAYQTRRLLGRPPGSLPPSGSAVWRKHGSLPGTMHARTSAPPLGGALSQASLPPPHLSGTFGSRSHAEAFWVRVYFPQSLLCTLGLCFLWCVCVCFPPSNWLGSFRKPIRNHEKFTFFRDLKEILPQTSRKLFSQGYLGVSGN